MIELISPSIMLHLCKLFYCAMHSQALGTTLGLCNKAVDDRTGHYSSAEGEETYLHIFTVIDNGVTSGKGFDTLFWHPGPPLCSVIYLQFVSHALAME